MSLSIRPLVEIYVYAAYGIRFLAKKGQSGTGIRQTHIIPKRDTLIWLHQEWKVKSCLPSNYYHELQVAT